MSSDRNFQEGDRPNSLLLQWHITERCNLKCNHCYQDNSPAQELDFENLMFVLEEYKNLLKMWTRNKGNKSVRAHITVTGGEPFVRRDFLDLLQVFSDHKDTFSFAILTNGTFIDQRMAERLEQLGVGFVQVSMEGTQATHDRIRGPGTFEQTEAAIRCLVKAGVPTVVSFTAQRGNYHEFTEVAKLGQKLGVRRVWADRVVPQGRNRIDMMDQVLSNQETRTFFELMLRSRKNFIRRIRYQKTEIAMRRALQFLVGGGQPYHCTAGDTLVTVMPNGDLYPCRRMPIRVGNLLEDPLDELYYCELFENLRNHNKIPENCRECVFSKYCRGGSRCLSYAITGDPFQADPGCWCTNGHSNIVNNCKIIHP